MLGKDGGNEGYYRLETGKENSGIWNKKEHVRDLDERTRKQARKTQLPCK